MRISYVESYHLYILFFSVAVVLMWQFLSEVNALFFGVAESLCIFKLFHLDAILLFKFQLQIALFFLLFDEWVLYGNMLKVIFVNATLAYPMFECNPVNAFGICYCSIYFFGCRFNVELRHSKDGEKKIS